MGRGRRKAKNNNETYVNQGAMEPLCFTRFWAEIGNPMEADIGPKCTVIH